LRDLAESGVTVLRLMLEYAQDRHRYLERPVGRFNPHVVRFWDDLIRLCERVGLRLLLTPFDTYWTWLKWHAHPYNRKSGGPLDTPSRLLLSQEAREAIKARLTFAVDRWGRSGAVFAWDLWNEIHIAQAEDSADCFPEFIADLSDHVRRLEHRLYGKSRPQTVSIFGPELTDRPTLGLADPIFRHSSIDFASIHIYAHATIDDPSDTVAPALAMARIVQDSIAEIRDGRPFFDSEHGPIHRYKDKRRPLPEDFDDEYFRHLQWAHLAAGGAGGGMRWPNRKPHMLTQGMHAAQRAMAAFLPLIDWPTFDRKTVEIKATAANRVHAIGCSSQTQTVVWMVRADHLAGDGRLDRYAPPLAFHIAVPGLDRGRYRVTRWDTLKGVPMGAPDTIQNISGTLLIPVEGLVADMGVAICRLP
jgi:mannan endo-1,4-beta-mannosidase